MLRKGYQQIIPRDPVNRKEEKNTDLTNLDGIFKSRGITLPTKVCLVKAMVFPVVMYGCVPLNNILIVSTQIEQKLLISGTV